MLRLALVLAFCFSLKVQAAPPVTSTGAEAMPENILERPNAFLLEVLGKGGLYSIAYERALADRVAVGGGLSYWPENQQTQEFGESDSRVFTIPVYGNAYLYQVIRSKIFATGGITWAFASADTDLESISGNGPIGTIGVGYEYRANEKSYLIRVTPQILIGDEITPWIGLSIGLLTS
jgi:hypothetical protein